MFFSPLQKSLFLFLAFLRPSNKMSSAAPVSLPILPALKISGNTVYVGHPQQLVDLLSTDVAQAIVEVHRTKGNMPLYKCKLRCKTLFQGNLDVALLVDFPNVPIQIRASEVDASKEEALFSVIASHGVLDAARASRFQTSFQDAVAFWAAKMEDEVTKLYTDKTPKQIGAYVSKGLIEAKINVFQGRPFDAAAFLSFCVAQKALPAFKIAFGWIGSKEDAESEEHIWGFKFEMSIFPQYTAPRKSLESAKKKRKAEVEEAAAVVDSQNVVESK